MLLAVNTKASLKMVIKMDMEKKLDLIEINTRAIIVTILFMVKAHEFTRMVANTKENLRKVLGADRVCI